MRAVVQLVISIDSDEKANGSPPKTALRPEPPFDRGVLRVGNGPGTGRSEAS